MADRQRRLLVAAVAVVLLLAVAGGVATYRLTSDQKRSSSSRSATPAQSAPFEVRGAVVQYAGDDGTLIACESGDGTLSSLPTQPQVQVVVHDATGRVVALGAMDSLAQVADVTCTRAFSVAAVPPGLRFYQLELGGRSLGWFTEAQLRQFVAVGGTGTPAPTA
ncbi:hypothetical protein [Angustibacter aerolatus]